MKPSGFYVDPIVSYLDTMRYEVGLMDGYDLR